MWAIAVREQMYMQCSDKNVIIPEGIPARAAQRALIEQGVIVKIEAHGVDVGTDVTAELKRCPKKISAWTGLRSSTRTWTLWMT